VFRLLEGYRDQPPADLDAIALTLVKTSQLVTDLPAVRELDINPLLADDRGVMALDARVRVADEAKDPRHPMALRPYPVEWVRRLDVPGLGTIELRPIRPDDEALYEEFFQHVSATDARMRFFTPMRRLSHAHRARLTQIDYAREIAFVAIETGGALLGVARYHADPDYTQAEYGVLVRSDLKGRGLGWRLMEHLIAYARAEGLAELTGWVLAENTTMLHMCRKLGFAVEAAPDEPTLRLVRLALARTPPGLEP
jgi:acetyltransferase